MATQVQVPALGESITQAILVKWHKNDGDTVAVDEPLCELETDKANTDIPANSAGVLRRLKQEGETVAVGESVAMIEAGGAAARVAAAVTPVAMSKAPISNLKSHVADSKSEIDPSSAIANRKSQIANSSDLSPAVRRVVAEHKLDAAAIAGTGPGGRMTKEDAEAAAAKVVMPEVTPDANSKSEIASRKSQIANHQSPADGIRREPMSKIRKKIAERLVQAQHTAAILTTFNEVDLTEVIGLRGRLKEQFEKVHGVGLGFMSFFARAVVQGLREVPKLNAFVEGDDIVYHDSINLGIAVSTKRGLAVPVLRNVQEMSFARIEGEIKRLAQATRDGKLSLEELSGGTFSITNGGVFGSLLSTPILNPPQSGILGMHTIQKRPMVVNDKIEIRSMMYVALSYDHRIVDGKEAITFLMHLKQLLEDPARLILEI
ncbi:MAG: 2-oxoglutarate dehydrogenase complex dihydrolipoyllysine-residue succinyltransferase [Tepidisphaerales bacterium]